jgi:flagellar hook assembly protein FlgD
VRATVYDRHGEEIRVISDNEMPAGTHSINWDGRDGSGQVVPSGTYLVLINKSNPERLKLVVIK